jgi:osmotically-inducible protein OsmY
MTRRVASILLGFSLLPLVSAQTKEDDRIYDDVRRKLANDADVKGGGIDVTVKGGAVTLKGEVRTEKAKQKATVLAKKVKGVTSVDNQLKLFGVS